MRVRAMDDKKDTSSELFNRLLCLTRKYAESGDIEAKNLLAEINRLGLADYNSRVAKVELNRGCFVPLNSEPCNSVAWMLRQLKINLRQIAEHLAQKKKGRGYAW